jgi:hypothetical protein
MKYIIPFNWRDTCDGQGCSCGAYSESDCCHCGPCEGVDWTEREVYELREEVNAKDAEIGRMRVAIREAFEYMRNEAKKHVDGVCGS